MDQDRPAGDLRAELSEVDRDLENLRKSAASVRADVGDADDPTDRGALIQQADELDNLIDRLSLRREDLLKRIGAES